MLLPTPGDLEAAARVRVKDAIHAGAGDFDPRSILRMSIGNRLNDDSDEYPVPKSSIARSTPSDFSSCSRRTARSASAIITVSVISSASDDGGKPLASSDRRTSSTIVSDWSCFTEQATGEKPRARRYHEDPA